jgi:transposase
MLRRTFGVDVHRDLIVVTKLGEEGKETRSFGVGFEELRECINWLRLDECMDGAMESTGVYWVPIYTTLREAGFNVCVANAYQVKAIPGRKSDVKDSEWLAYLFRAELIKPSYIPNKEHQDLRTLTRLRTRLAETETDFKNRAHKVLQLCNIRLASKLSDLFGESGLRILEALLNNGDIDEALKASDRRIQAKTEEIKASIIGNLSQMDIFELKIILENIKLLQTQIQQVDERLSTLADRNLVDKLSKIPGVAPTSAYTLIAEIADPNRFENQKKVGGWSGLAPSRYQTARTDRHGHITKHGSSWLRRIATQSAKAASKSKSNLAQSYNRIAGRRGKAIATVALARQIVTIAWHTIKTGQEYSEEHYAKKTRYRIKHGKAEKYNLSQTSRILSQATRIINPNTSCW